MQKLTTRITSRYQNILFQNIGAAPKYFKHLMFRNRYFPTSMQRWHRQWWARWRQWRWEMLITRHENRFGSLVMSSTMADCIAAGVHTHLSLPVCSSHLRLSLINLINRNHIALSVRFCVCINARALMGAIISSRQRENLFVLYQPLLSRVASIKRKDLYRRSFNLIICRISL